MNKNSLEVIEFGKWNRKIINAYWFIAVIALFTEIVILLTVVRKNGNANLNYVRTFILRPVIMDVVLLLAVEIIYSRTQKRWKEGVKYLIIICGTVLVANMVLVHYSVAVIYVLFAFPIFFSAFYGSRRIATFALVLNLLVYVMVYFLYLPTLPPKVYRHNFMDFCTTLSFLIVTYILVVALISRSKEIIQSFFEIYKSEQELTIQNFIMEFNSKIEPATGLYNHKTFYEYLEKLSEQSDDFDFDLSLAVIDIDNFKRINDTYGHGLGDEVIKTLAEIIKVNIGSDDYAARYGGEEFAIIFTDKDKAKAFEIAEVIRNKFNSIEIKEMENERFSVSIGISQHAKEMPKQDFFDAADDALYEAKKSGKNKTIICK